MWVLDHKESWVPKNWCFWTVVLEKTLESSLDRKEIKPVNPKENQPWIFIGRTGAEAEATILCHLIQRANSEKDPDTGKDWGQEEKGVTEDDMVGWHHWFNGHEFQHTPGDSEGQGSLVCYTPWGHRVGHDLVTVQQPGYYPTYNPYSDFPIITILFLVAFFPDLGLIQTIYCIYLSL